MRHTVKTASKRKPRAIVKRKPRAMKPAPLSLTEAVEKVLITGDLTPLTPEQRLDYYRAVCRSLGLNPLTRPFDYLVFRENEGGPGRLALYARKDCTEQLRKLYGVGVVSLKREIADDLCIVEAVVKDRMGRPDAGTGVVALYKFKDGRRINLSGKELSNAIMKAETKAKRRATLSICGLGFLDESEIDTVENYSMVTPGGRVIVEQESTGSQEAADAVAAEKIKAFKEAKLLREQPANPENQPALFYTWFEQSQTAQISGAKELLTANKDLLGKHWNPTAQAIVVDLETLEVLKFQFEQRGVPFRPLKAV